MSRPLHRRALLHRLLAVTAPAWWRGARPAVAGDRELEATAREPRAVRWDRPSTPPQAATPARARVGPVDALASGEAVNVRLEDLMVLVVNDDGRFRAVSAVCTHEECEVEWNHGAAEVRCPCHDGRFDLDGSVKAGPPPAPLVRFATEVVEGDLWVVDREPEG